MKKIIFCFTVYLVGILISYSQETAPTEPAKAFVPPTLPTEVYGIVGEKIPVTVLEISEDKAEILIRTREGDVTKPDGSVLKGTRWMSLHQIGKLRPDIVEMLTGSKIPVMRKQQPINGSSTKSLTESQKVYKEIQEKKRAIKKKYESLSTKELLEKFKADDPDILFVMNSDGQSNAHYKNKLNYHDGKDPNLAQRYSPSEELLHKIEIKEGDEIVSLRPQFEKLGMVAHQQVENTCFQHAAYHLYQYELRKNGLPVPSYEQFVQMIGGGSGDPYKILHLKLPGKTMRSYEILTQIQELDHELIKHQLRNGRPCIVSGDFPQGAHVVLAIGFIVKDGKTTFEYLDSNRIWQDKGYRFSGPGVSGNFKGEFSAWYE